MKTDNPDEILKQYVVLINVNQKRRLEICDNIIHIEKKVKCLINQKILLK